MDTCAGMWVHILDPSFPPGSALGSDNRPVVSGSGLLGPILGLPTGHPPIESACE